MMPQYQEIERPLLKELFRRGGSSRPSDRRNGKDIYETLGEHFDLTKQDYEEEIVGPKGRRSKWHNMVQWARRKCVDHGYIDNLNHGVWTLTEQGEREASRP